MCAGLAGPDPALAAPSDAACTEADIELMTDMNADNAPAIIPKMDGGLKGMCGSCIVANAAGGREGIMAKCTPAADKSSPIPCRGADAVLVGQLGGKSQDEMVSIVATMEGGLPGPCAVCLVATGGNEKKVNKECLGM